jgi:cytidylate kinase
MRRAATRSGMSILQMNEYALSHAEIDAEVDNYLISLRQGSESIIVDSRLAWHFLPSSFKVYLVVDPQVGAQRIFDATRLDERYTSVEAACADSIERQRLETERYLELYSVDCRSWYNYDLIVDTTHAAPEQIADLILEGLKRFQPGAARGPECWISPKRLIPAREIPGISSATAATAGNRDAQPQDDAGLSVAVGVFQGSYLIISGDSRVSAAIQKREPFIPCRLAAFEVEEIAPGLSLRSFAETSTSLLTIHSWEQSHGFEFISYPPWLVEGEAKTNHPC